MEKVKPDWYAAAIDETAHYTIEEEDKPFIERIVGVYFFDRNEYTHCCEVTPSHYLRYLSDSVRCKDDTPDDVRERIYELYEHCGGEDCYMHVSSVDRIPEKFKHHYGEPQDADAEDRGEGEVREHFQGNCPF